MRYILVPVDPKEIAMYVDVPDNIIVEETKPIDP